MNRREYEKDQLEKQIKAIEEAITSFGKTIDKIQSNAVLVKLELMLEKMVEQHNELIKKHNELPGTTSRRLQRIEYKKRNPSQKQLVLYDFEVITVDEQKYNDPKFYIDTLPFNGYCYNFKDVLKVSPNLMKDPMFITLLLRQKTKDGQFNCIFTFEDFKWLQRTFQDLLEKKNLMKLCLEHDPRCLHIVGKLYYMNKQNIPLEWLLIVLDHDHSRVQVYLILYFNMLREQDKTMLLDTILRGHTLTPFVFHFYKVVLMRENYSVYEDPMFYTDDVNSSQLVDILWDAIYRIIHTIRSNRELLLLAIDDDVFEQTDESLKRKKRLSVMSILIRQSKPMTTNEKNFFWWLENLYEIDDDIWRYAINKYPRNIVPLLYTKKGDDFVEEFTPERMSQYIQYTTVNELVDSEVWIGMDLSPFFPKSGSQQPNEPIDIPSSSQEGGSPISDLSDMSDFINMWEPIESANGDDLVPNISQQDAQQYREEFSPSDVITDSNELEEETGINWEKIL